MAVPGLRNSSLSLRWGQVNMWKLVVYEAVNQAKAPNLYTPRLSTPHLQTAQHITQTQAEKLTWVSN